MVIRCKSAVAIFDILIILIIFVEIHGKFKKIIISVIINLLDTR